MRFVPDNTVLVNFTILDDHDPVVVVRSFSGDMDAQHRA
jgi:hypothetical protein